MRHNLPPEVAPWADQVERRLDALSLKQNTTRQMNIQTAESLAPSVRGSRVTTELVEWAVEVSPNDGVVHVPVPRPPWARKVYTLASGIETNNPSMYGDHGRIVCRFLSDEPKEFNLDPEFEGELIVLMRNLYRNLPVGLLGGNLRLSIQFDYLVGVAEVSGWVMLLWSE